jgi:hypothetical protein
MMAGTMSCSINPASDGEGGVDMREEDFLAMVGVD